VRSGRVAPTGRLCYNPRMATPADLTRRQAEILECIRRGVSERGYPPSIREIGERVGLSSSSTVHTYLRQLEDRGLIRRDPARPRCIEVLASSLDGTVVPRSFTTSHAPDEMSGSPSPPPADVAYVPVLEDLDSITPETQPRRIPLPRSLVGSEEAFLFQVQGDSMRDAAILHGDYVLARRHEAAEDGDIVVALVNHEITVKRLFHGHGVTRLESDNRRMKPLYVRDAKLIGKVVAVLRSLL
jgi:repressor LexA